MARKLNPKIFNDWILKDIKDYSNRFEVYYGGGASSKSYEVSRKMLLKALKYKRKVLVIRKVQSTIKDSIWSLFIEHISNSGYYDYCKFNKSDLEIELPNGSIFLFKGMDNPEKIKSINAITDIVIEEATELTLDDFTQLNIRLRANVPHAQIYLMFNPVSKLNWVYEHWFINPPVNAKVMHTSYLHNKFLPQDIIDELNELQNRNPAYYRIYALGEFATLDKLVFPVYEKRLISKEELTGLDRCIGLDFGYVNDPSAIIECYYDKTNRRVYITSEYVKKGMLNDEIAKTMIDLGLHKDKSYGDSAEPKSIKELQLKGIRIDAVEKGKNSVIHGIQWLNQQQIIIDERCFKTIEEFENYTYRKDKKTNEYINEPVDAYNHTIDAIRYALSKHIKGQNNVVIRTKASIGMRGRF